jgi:hypothetical protein
MTNPTVAYLGRLLSEQPQGSFPHRLASAKLAAVLGDRDVAATDLQILLQVAGDRLQQDFVFHCLVHIAILTDQLGLAEDIINRRFGTANWFNLSFTDRKKGPLPVLRWKVEDQHRSCFLLGRELLDSERFDFIVNRLLYTLPVFMTHFSLGDREEAGEVYLNLGDAGEVPGLAFCSSRPEFFLIPDPTFVSSGGYREMRARIIKNDVPWPNRQPIAVWRGASTGRPTDKNLGWRSLPRVKLCEIAQNHRQLIDAGISSVVQFAEAESINEIGGSGIMRDRIEMEHFGRYKYQIDIDGNSNSWPGLFQKLLTGSPVVKVASAPGYWQWYYDRLEPWVNYVPVASDMSDLVEVLTWLGNNDSKACRIGERGRDLALSLDYEGELKEAARTIAAALRNSRIAVPALKPPL